MNLLGCLALNRSPETGIKLQPGSRIVFDDPATGQQHAITSVTRDYHERPYRLPKHFCQRPKKAAKIIKCEVAHVGDAEDTRL